jgi:iron complex transport system substrate-binding protein
VSAWRRFRIPVGDSTLDRVPRFIGLDFPLRLGSLALPAAILAIVMCSSCGQRPRRSEPVAFSVRDDLGRSVTFSSPVQRCVSLAPSITETICFLGYDTLLSGVTSYCNFPKSVKRKQVVGDLRSPDLETIISLRPDVVFLSKEGNTRQTWERLEKAGLRTFVTDPRDLDGVLRSMERIHAVLSGGNGIGSRLDSLRCILAGVSPSAGSAASVLFIISIDPLIVAGRGTFIDEVIARAGAVNAAHMVDVRFPSLNRETILSLNPAVVLIAGDLKISPQLLMALYPEWRDIEAFRRGNVHSVDADIFLRPGPRLGEAIQRVSTLVQGTASPARPY